MCALQPSKTEDCTGDKCHCSCCSRWFDLARAFPSDSVHEVKKLHVKCHYYCTRTVASVTAVSPVTENRDISVVFLTLRGSEAVVVSGVLGLVADLLSVVCTDCETVLSLLLASRRFVLQKAD